MPLPAASLDPPLNTSTRFKRLLGVSSNTGRSLDYPLRVYRITNAFPPLLLLPTPSTLTRPGDGIVDEGGADEDDCESEISKKKTVFGLRVGQSRGCMMVHEARPVPP